MSSTQKSKFLSKQEAYKKSIKDLKAN
jgi:hypothetical protein